ncbi:MAG: hypothetical protein ACR2KC_07605 [Acidimicrobiales bacterium]
MPDGVIDDLTAPGAMPVAGIDDWRRGPGGNAAPYGLETLCRDDQRTPLYLHQL